MERAPGQARARAVAFIQEVGVRLGACWNVLFLRRAFYLSYLVPTESGADARAVLLAPGSGEARSAWLKEMRDDVEWLTAASLQIGDADIHCLLEQAQSREAIGGAE